MQEPVKALIQSYIRTKARSYTEFLNTMQLKANSSNNTIFADGEGALAFGVSNGVLRRGVLRGVSVQVPPPREGSA